MGSALEVEVLVGPLLLQLLLGNPQTRVRRRLAPSERVLPQPQQRLLASVERLGVPRRRRGPLPLPLRLRPPLGPLCSGPLPLLPLQPLLLHPQHQDYLVAETSEQRQLRWRLQGRPQVGSALVVQAARLRPRRCLHQLEALEDLVASERTCPRRVERQDLRLAAVLLLLRLQHLLLVFSAEPRLLLPPVPSPLDKARRDKMQQPRRRRRSLSPLRLPQLQAPRPRQQRHSQLNRPQHRSVHLLLRLHLLFGALLLALRPPRLLRHLALVLLPHLRHPRRQRGLSALVVLQQSPHQHRP